MFGWRRADFPILAVAHVTVDCMQRHHAIAALGEVKGCGEVVAIQREIPPATDPSLQHNGPVADGILA